MTERYVYRNDEKFERMLVWCSDEQNAVERVVLAKIADSFITLRTIGEEPAFVCGIDFLTSVYKFAKPLPYYFRDWKHAERVWAKAESLFPGRCNKDEVMGSELCFGFNKSIDSEIPDKLCFFHKSGIAGDMLCDLCKYDSNKAYTLPISDPWFNVTKPELTHDKVWAILSVKGWLVVRGEKGTANLWTDHMSLNTITGFRNVLTGETMTSEHAATWEAGNV